MSEAENDSLQKWDKWDFKFSTPEASHAAEESREAYKAALRREIEKLIDFETEGSEWDAALDKVLSLLDTVEP